jgi:hypothetical protein
MTRHVNAVTLRFAAREILLERERMEGESATGTCSGVFTHWEPDEIAEFLGTGFDRFETSSGLHGLAKVTGDTLEVLAVMSPNPGTGQFREFIRATKEIYRTVTVLEDWNPIVTAALQRYGFQRIEGGWKWDR